MTDNSNIVLRWEINNAASRLARGKVASEVFDEGGFRWAASIERRGRSKHGKINFSLRCDADTNRHWKCEAHVAVHVLHSGGSFGQWTEKTFIFNDNESLWLYKSEFGWHSLTDSMVYYVNDKVTMEFRVNIISSEKGDLIADPGRFVVSYHTGNVILTIGDNKLHVSKQILALHSSFFATRLFGDFAKNGIGEMELKDVDYQEFIDLMNLIFARTLGITDHTVKHILKLADQFQMEDVLEQAKKHLAQSKGIDAVTKLRIADKYGLVALRGRHILSFEDHCLLNFTSVNEVKQKLMSSPECANFSGDMKIAIFDRMTDFLLRWEIERAAEKFATGKVELGAFNQRGFRWTAAIERHPHFANDRIDFYLRCDSENHRYWHCDVKVHVHVPSQGTIHSFVERFLFNDNRPVWKYTTRRSVWNELCWNIDSQGKAAIQFRINIVSSARGEPYIDPGKFAAPNRMSNVILKIGDDKLHVFKELLALHSPVFETLFFGDFAEKGKGEVELQDVVYEEFVDLLNLLYVRTRELTDRSVFHLLKLADQFHMQEILDQSKKYLIQSAGIDIVTKMMLADEYRIDELREICLKSFNSVADLTRTMKSSLQYANFSEGMRSAISDRIIVLTVMD